MSHEVSGNHINNEQIPQTNESRYFLFNFNNDHDNITLSVCATMHLDAMMHQQYIISSGFTPRRLY